MRLRMPELKASCKRIDLRLQIRYTVNIKKISLKRGHAMDVMSIFNIIAGFCSIASLIISCITVAKVTKIQKNQKIKGNNNVQAMGDAHVGEK